MTCAEIRLLGVVGVVVASVVWFLVGTWAGKQDAQMKPPYNLSQEGEEHGTRA